MYSEAKNNVMSLNLKTQHRQFNPHAFFLPVFGALTLISVATQSAQAGQYSKNFWPFDPSCTTYSPGGDAAHAFINPKTGKCENRRSGGEFPDFRTPRSAPVFFKTLENQDWPQEKVQIGKAGGGNFREVQMKQLVSAESKFHYNGFSRFGHLEEGQVGLFLDNNELWLASRIRVNKNVNHILDSKFGPWQRSSGYDSEPIRIKSFVVIDKGEVWFETLDGKFGYVRITDAITVVVEAARWLMVDKQTQGSLTAPQKAQFLAALQKQDVSQSSLIPPTVPQAETPIAPIKPNAPVSKNPTQQDFIALVEGSRGQKVASLTDAQKRDRQRLLAKVSPFQKPFAGGWRTADGQRYFVYPSMRSDKNRQSCIIIEKNGSQDLQIGVAVGGSSGKDMNVGSERMFKTDRGDMLALRTVESDRLVPLHPIAGDASLTNGNLEAMQQNGCMTSFLGVPGRAVERKGL